MTGILNELLAFGPWTWIAIAVLLFVLETVIPGVHFMWFGVAALVLGAVLLVAVLVAPDWVAGLGWQWEIVAFAALSVATLFLVKRFVRPGVTPTDAAGLNTRATQYVGRTYVLADAIERGRGKVAVGDTLWLAEGPELPAGTLVRVTGHNGTVLSVEKAH
ncbi:MAG: NfeD family protein [Hyphomicrobiaceae bacterium]|nr:NfeD family protein [Hyphomicrobiaceae bacterium]